jgi:acyl-CoA reductase-like NAD-dependent aldehyde dehydrogenase
MEVEPTVVDPTVDDTASPEATVDDTPAESPFSTKSPLDGSRLTDVAPSTPDAVRGAVERARTAQRAWAQTSARERAIAVSGLKKRILARAEEIADVVHKECGKPIEEAALAEVLPNADLVDYWVASIEEALDPQNVDLDAIHGASSR